MPITWTNGDTEYDNEIQFVTLASMTSFKSVFAILMQSTQMFCYDTEQSQSIFNEFFNNINVWIQSACARRLWSVREYFMQSFDGVGKWKIN